MQHPTYSFLTSWKKEMYNVIKLRYPDASDKKIESILDRKIEEKLNNRRILLVNNYNAKMVNSTVLDIINMIESNSLIVGGGACIYKQHNSKRNLLIEFILYVMEGRDKAKAERKKYAKGTYEWRVKDRAQNAFKLLINSLYGCLGYPGFILFNIFLAESITSTGRNIITTAINAIEGFLGDALYFDNENDLFNVMKNINKDAIKITKDIKYKKFFNKIVDNIEESNLVNLVVERFISKCLFKVNDNLRNRLLDIFSQMDSNTLLVFYYKNNLLEFLKNDIMKDKIKELIKYNGVLMVSELKAYRDDHARELIQDIWSLCSDFVHYNYQIFDKVRKAMYLEKKRSLYTDTDSVFISLDGIVRLIMEEIITDSNEVDMTSRDLQFTSANITLSLMDSMIKDSLYDFCISMNVTDAYNHLLKMKNEFFFLKIMFFNVKKRYISHAILQEGELINDGEGDIEIKGLEFIKASIKPAVKNYYTQLCENKILHPDVIPAADIFRDIVKYKAYLREQIQSGNDEFFKQVSVKRPDVYKTPFSQQGVVAITLWNTLCPEYTLEFPNDVNIVPIKALTFPAPPKPKDGTKVVINSDNPRLPTDRKYVNDFKELYPDRYELLNNKIYQNSNKLIRHMTLTSIAIPKNIDYELPEHIKWLMDLDQVIQKIVMPFLPVFDSLGLISQPVASNDKRMSNIVEI